jgi:hypothetical protein
MANPPNYTPNIGGLATSRYDFYAHYEGTNFRHTAQQIDVDPAVIIDGEPYITVADALYAIGDYITVALSNGEGFVTVGDGYDTYHNANGTINFDPTIPSLDTLLNPLFQAIANAQVVLSGSGAPLPFPIAPTTVPAEYARVQYGGIVVIKAGTYIVKQMIQVPPGITLLGEGYGTKIINASGLNTDVALGIAPSPATGAINGATPITVTNASNSSPIEITTSPPHGLSTGAYVSIINVNGNTAANTELGQITVVSTTQFTINNTTGSGTMTSSPNAQVLINNPVFFILPDPDRVDNDEVIDPTAGNVFMFSRETKIVNLVVADNFVEPTILGDLAYKDSQNLTNSSFLTSPPLIYQQTGSNLTLDGVLGIGRVSFTSSNPYVVNKVTASLVETFVYPIYPNTGSIPTTGTILKVDNCFIDGFAVPLVFFGLTGNKDFVNITNSKMRAYGYLEGNSSSSMDNTFLSTSAANINIVGNHFYGNDYNVVSIVDINQISGSPTLQQKAKASNSSNTISIANMDTSANTTVNDKFRFFTYGTIGFPGAYLSISGESSGPPTVISTIAPYNLSSPYSIVNATDYEFFANILLVDTVNGTQPWTIILPDLTKTAVNVEKTATIKDMNGGSATNNIIVVSQNGILEGVPTTLIAPGSNGNAVSATPIYVASVSGFPSSGTFNVITTAGIATIAYTGTTGGATPNFTGCSVVAGSGNLATNNGVNPKVLSSPFDSWTFVSVNDGTTIGWFMV